MSKLAVRYAAKRQPAAHFAVGSPHALPFSDGSFDAVFSCFALRSSGVCVCAATVRSFRVYIFLHILIIDSSRYRLLIYILSHTARRQKPREKAQKQHVGGQENREGPSGRWAGSPHTPHLPLAPALAAPHWSTSPRSSRAGIVTCVARVGGPPHCTVAI